MIHCYATQQARILFSILSASCDLSTHEHASMLEACTGLLYW